MASGAPDKVCQFVEVGGCFPGILLGSRALRWIMPRTVFGDVVMLHWLYLAAKPSHVGVDVDRLAYPLHCPTTCSRQTRGQSFLLGAALSHHATVVGGTFLGGARPPSLNIWWSVDRSSTCMMKYYMEKPAFTKVCLSRIRDIMVIMCVLLVESLCQTIMGWILALEYVLSGMCGLLQPHPIMTSTKRCRFPRHLCWKCLSATESPRVGWLNTRARPRSRRELEQAVRWQNSAYPRLS
jgi:hypothetical protein